MNLDELNAVVLEKPSGCFLKCWIQPRSSRNTVVGVHGDALKIALTAPPVDGKANQELLKFLAKCLGLSKSEIRIAAGDSSRNKTILITSMDKAALIKKFLQDKTGK